jgi:hypothetical protein
MVWHGEPHTPIPTRCLASRNQGTGPNSAILDNVLQHEKAAKSGNVIPFVVHKTRTMHAETRNSLNFRQRPSSVNPGVMCRTVAQRHMSCTRFDMRCIVQVACLFKMWPFGKQKVKHDNTKGRRTLRLQTPMLSCFLLGSRTDFCRALGCFDDDQLIIPKPGPTHQTKTIFHRMDRGLDQTPKSQVCYGAAVNLAHS